MQSTVIGKIGESKMSQIFDTLKYTKRAMAAGIPQEAAEFHAEELATVMNDSLVTKEHLRHELLGLENRLTLKIVGIVSVLLTVCQVIGHFFK